LKKNFFKIGRKGYQKKRNFALISKMLREVPKDFFSEKQFFAKFSKSLKIQFFFKKYFSLLPNLRLLHIFEISAKFRLF
jgi:hypothetical protein